MIANTPDALAAQIIENADYFTTVRFKGSGRYDRREFPTLPEAEADAAGDRRAMIYAVAGIRSVFVK